MDYISRLSLQSSYSRFFTAPALAYALDEPRHRGLPSVPTFPGLSHVNRTAVIEEALQLYPADLYEGGAWAELPWGRVRYWIIGPEHGSQIVLVHSFSGPAIVYKAVSERLVEAGYRVLLYDLYGRGHSDAPQTEYSATLFSTQLALLLQYVGWSKPALVGYSMGGPIVASFTHLYPHLAGNKIVFIAPGGIMKASDFSLRKRLMTTRLVQTVLGSSLYRWISRIRYTSSGPSLQPVPITAVARISKFTPLQELVLPGYLKALCSSQLDGPMRNQKDAFESLSSRSVLIIFGRNDTTVPVRCGIEISELARGSELFVVDGAGHEIGFTHPDVVAGAIIRHLQDL